jgi:hypothetical protein
MPPLPVPAPELPPPPPELPPPPEPPPELPPPELPPPEVPPLELPPLELLLALELGAELAGGWLTAGAVLCTTTTGRGFGRGRRIGGSAEAPVLAGAEIDTCEVLSASGAGAGADV